MDKFEKLLTQGLRKAIIADFRAGIITAWECRDQLIYLQYGINKSI